MGTQGRLQDKVAVVTGAASGIGAGTVRRFIEEGAKVIIADIQDEPGLALAKELGANTRYIHTDVTSEEQVADILTKPLPKLSFTKHAKKLLKGFEGEKVSTSSKSRH